MGVDSTLWAELLFPCTVTCGSVSQQILISFDEMKNMRIVFRKLTVEIQTARKIEKVLRF
jgi:hypothetical protein